MIIKLMTVILFLTSAFSQAAIIRSTDKDDPTYVVVTPLNEEWVRFEHCVSPKEPCRHLGDYRFSGLKNRRRNLNVMGYSLYAAQVGILAVGLVAGLGLISGAWAPAGLAATVFNAATGTGALIANKIIFLVTGTGMALSGTLVGGITLGLTSYYATTIQAIDGGRKLSMADSISEKYLRSGDVVIEVPMPIVTFVKTLREALSKVHSEVKLLETPDENPALDFGPLHDQMWQGLL